MGMEPVSWALIGAAAIGATAAGTSAAIQHRDAKKAASEQRSASRRAENALKNQPVAAQAQQADSADVARQQAARRAALAGIRSTYTANGSNGSGGAPAGGGLKSTLGA